MREREWTDRLSDRLHELVSAEAPAGLGTWAPAWEIVEAPSGELLDELSRIEDGGGSRDRAKRLAVRLREAWREAGQQYRQDGRGGRARQ